MFHVKHVLADCISLAPPKCGQSSLIPSLVLSKPDPHPLGSGLVSPAGGTGDGTGGGGVHPSPPRGLKDRRDTSCRRECLFNYKGAAAGGVRSGILSSARAEWI